MKGGPIGYLKSINRSSLVSAICLTPDPIRSHSGRKAKAVVCPYPRPGLSHNITFGAAFGIAYILDPKDVYGPDFPGETSRVLKEKEEMQYGEYRTPRFVLEVWDKL